jgi:hypothetical protein
MVAITATNAMSTVARVNTLRVAQLAGDKVVFVTGLNRTGLKMSKHRAGRPYPFILEIVWLKRMWHSDWKYKLRRKK